MNRNTVYFVGLSVFLNDYVLPQIFSEIITDAENETDALGQAILNLRKALPNAIYVDFNVQEYDHENPSRINDLEHTLKLSQETFLNLLDISAITIMQNVHKLLLETNQGVEHILPNKIPAIKLLREHLKPFIGLKGCKEIVELWIEDICKNRTKTGLINIVRDELKNNGW